MAIVFECPHCKTSYRLKDELAGKTATCKNPNCRKVIPIPQPTVLTAAAADLDAIAAAAFSDEGLPALQAAGATIEITCSGCDHVWSVEASKEGKNVQCPECRRPNRVPLRKKEEKADWRTGQAGKPSMAKVETGMDREGAFASAQAGGISTQTAQEIVRDRDAQEEPEVRRRRFIKRGVIAFLALTVLGGGGYYALKKKRVSDDESTMDQAVAALTPTKESPKKDVRMYALILRASGEHRSRTAKSEEHAKQALADLRTARNKLINIVPSAKSPEGGPDRSGILAEVAVTMANLLGSAEQVENGWVIPQDKVIEEIGRALQAIGDSELCADAVRAITRKCVELGKPTIASNIARQVQQPVPNEMLGQVGLELLRLDSAKHRDEVQRLVASVQTTAKGGDATSIKTLRLALPRVPGKKEVDSAPFSYIASAEDKALRGQIADVRRGLGAATPEERISALTAAAQAAIETNTTEAAKLLEAAATEAKATKGLKSPWVGVRICRLLAKATRYEAAEMLASSLPDDQIKAWARLEILRGRLTQAKGQKAEDSWLEPVGDPIKHAAAAKAREEMARHNAAAGKDDYRAIIRSWDKDTVQPFGIAGTILGRDDRNK